MQYIADVFFSALTIILFCCVVYYVKQLKKVESKAVNNQFINKVNQYYHSFD